MKFIISLILLGHLCLAFSCPQDAFTPTKISQDQELLLNGIGMRLAYFIKIKVYAAGLYLPQKSQSPEAIKSMKGPKVIDMYFLRDLGKNKLIGSWKNKDYGLSRFPQELNTLNSYMRDVKKNSHGLILEFYKDGLVVNMGGEMKPKIYNPDFTQAVFNIFVGPNPPNRELKDGLLGLKTCKG